MQYHVALQWMYGIDIEDFKIVRILFSDPFLCLNLIVDNLSIQQYQFDIAEPLAIANLFSFSPAWSCIFVGVAFRF